MASTQLLSKTCRFCLPIETLYEITYPEWLERTSCFVVVFVFMVPQTFSDSKKISTFFASLFVLYTWSKCYQICWKTKTKTHRKILILRNRRSIFYRFCILKKSKISVEKMFLIVQYSQFSAIPFPRHNIQFRLFNVYIVWKIRINGL